jgi:hypothetical protein
MLRCCFRPCRMRDPFRACLRTVHLPLACTAASCLQLRVAIKQQQIRYSDGKIRSHTNIRSNFTSAARKHVLSIERGSDCTAGCKTKVIIVDLRRPIGRISSVKVRSLSVLQVRTQSRYLFLNHFLTGRGSCVNSFSLPSTPLVQCTYVRSAPVLRF